MEQLPAATPASPPLDANGSTFHARSHGTMAGTDSSGLSADEIALYDRQIRLWGAQAQERIRSADILLVSLRALGTEIAKNLTLAGIRSLTIVDDDVVTDEDLGAQYFLRDEDVGKRSRAEAAIPRIQELNPRVLVQSAGSLADLLQGNETFYAPFDCVIACDHDFSTLSLINAGARLASRPFYAAGIHGFYGFIFADLFMHEFVVERAKSNIATSIGPETMTRSVVGVTDKRERDGTHVEMVKKQEIYCPLILANSSSLPPDTLGNRRKLKSVPALLPFLRAVFEFQRNSGRYPINSSESDLKTFVTLATEKSRELQLPPELLKGGDVRSFMQNIGSEICPTAAFVGGRLSEDVINVLGKREQPIQNFALFDGENLEGRIYSLYSPPPEMAIQIAHDSNEIGAAPIDKDAEIGLGLDGSNTMSTNLGSGTEAVLTTGMPGNGPGTTDMPIGDGLSGMGMTQLAVSGASALGPSQSISDGTMAGVTSAPIAIQGGTMVNALPAAATLLAAETYDGGSNTTAANGTPAEEAHRAL